jgi:hypothetical protein
VLPIVRTLLVPLLLAACHGPGGTSDPGKDLMPKGATMVIAARGEDPKTWTRSFSVRAAYPALGIGDDGFARLQGHGWKRCESKYDEWSNHVDKSRGLPATVYQRTQYWNRDKDVLKILYSYRVEAISNPDTDLLMQRVTLSYYGAQTPKEMERWKLGYGASCGG